jgi:hypothetical protein
MCMQRRRTCTHQQSIYMCKQNGMYTYARLRSHESIHAYIHTHTHTHTHIHTSIHSITHARAQTLTLSRSNAHVNYCSLPYSFSQDKVHMHIGHIESPHHLAFTKIVVNSNMRKTGP